VEREREYVHAERRVTTPMFGQRAYWPRRQ